MRLAVLSNFGMKSCWALTTQIVSADVPKHIAMELLPFLEENYIECCQCKE